MRVLVTGGAGYVGSHVVLALAAHGHVPEILDDMSTGVYDAVPLGVMCHVMDAGDRDVLDLLTQRRYDAVIHCAASANVADSFADPIAYETNNVGVTAKLGMMCSAAGVEKFVFSSTGAVYGNPTSPLPFAEGDRLMPVSPYGESKLKAERVLSAMTHRLNIVTLRYFNVAGADPDLRAGQRNRKMGRLIDVVAETIVGDTQFVPINGGDYPTIDGSAVRDYVHATDVAMAHVRAIEYLQDGGASTTLNVGYGRGYSVFEVLSAAQRVAGHSIPFSLGARRKGDPAYCVADPTRIGQVLKWVPKYDDLEVMIRHAVAWRRCLPG